MEAGLAADLPHEPLAAEAVPQAGEDLGIDLLAEGEELDLRVAVNERFLPGDPAEFRGQLRRRDGPVEVHLHPEALVIRDRHRAGDGPGRREREPPDSNGRASPGSTPGPAEPGRFRVGTLKGCRDVGWPSFPLRNRRALPKGFPKTRPGPSQNPSKDRLLETKMAPLAEPGSIPASGRFGAFPRVRWRIRHLVCPSDAASRVNVREFRTGSSPLARAANSRGFSRTNEFLRGNRRLCDGNLRKKSRLPPV